MVILLTLTQPYGFIPGCSISSIIERERLRHGTISRSAPRAGGYGRAEVCTLRKPWGCAMISAPPKPPRPFSPIPSPKPKRLLKGKPMTLVAAFRCQNSGIMLIADREESDGYSRREVDKIYKVDVIACSCQVFIASAGFSGTIANAQWAVHRALNQSCVDGKNIILNHKEIIESGLKDFYKQYAANLKKQWVDALIVVAPLTNRVPILYRTERAMLVPKAYYAAEGSGKALSDYFADRLFGSSQFGGHTVLDKELMKKLGAFILREAEKSVDGVGMGADMWFIHEGNKSVQRFSSDEVKRIQDCIPLLNDALLPCLRNAIIPTDLAG